eukprot:SAG31_NODE_19332_length_605_cov_1.349802_1_plen_81_part_10
MLAKDRTGGLSHSDGPPPSPSSPPPLAPPLDPRVQVELQAFSLPRPLLEALAKLQLSPFRPSDGGDRSRAVAEEPWLMILL